MLRLGYKASAEQFGPNELLDFSILAEQRGFDSVFISDHFQPWRHTGGHAPFSMAWMGALGARTSRIIMGTSVLTPTFRYHPSVVAQAFGTLGVMFPERVILGVGTGESLNEVPATGPGVARTQGAHGAAQGSVGADPSSSGATSGSLSKANTIGPTRRRFTTGRRSAPDLRRSCRPGIRQVRRTIRRRIHLHQRQSAGTVPRYLAAQRGGGNSGVRPQARERRHDDRDEGLVRQRCRTRT
jgi:hypothetical protein